jgi:rod shape-determining protein MreC
VNNLLEFLTKHFHWLVFLLLETVSGVMLFGYNSYQGSVWISTANLVTGKVLEWQANVEQFFTLTRVNEELTQRNIVLEQKVQFYREKAEATLSSSEEGAIDSSINKTIEAPSGAVGGAFIPAKVVGNTIDRRDNLITIDRGSADGVEPDMGVVSGNGLVGVVYKTSLHYAIVIPVLNSRSRISCSIRNRHYFGYLTWEGGSPVEAYVEDVPRHAKFQKGEWVETSGYSAIFPKGIAVGKIIGIYNSPDGLSYRLKVHLSTDFACLRDVCVLNDKSLVEQQRLNIAALDSLELEKIKE